MSDHMTATVRCDRCDAVHSFNFPQGTDVARINHTPRPATWLRLDRFDFCSECRKDFEEWLEAKR